MQKQVRIIKTPQRESQKDVVYGITLKKETYLFASGTFYVEKWLGGDILLVSGTCSKPNTKEVNKYNFEDCTIETVGTNA